jgi:DNA polymerase-4/DNA polymerase V
MFSHFSWPHAILHIDGDAFFASVMRSVNPSLIGKPIVTGRERGIATAISYEAKACGVTRGMPYFEIKKKCPNCIFVESDYDLFALVSARMFSIMKNYSPYVEEYSIDEGFIDITGLRRMHRKSYKEIALLVKQELEQKLNITFSVGLSITKSLAKLASSFRKPSGFTAVKGKHIEYLLKNRKVRDIWGIGPNTAAYLEKCNIHTAFEFASLSEEFITANLSKPYYEIWQELRGKKIFELQIGKKEVYKSISKTETFTPPTNDKELLWARLMAHIEDAFKKARIYNYTVGRVDIFLKTQAFVYHPATYKLLNRTSFPLTIHTDLRKTFDSIYSPSNLYRTTGCTISDLEDAALTQTSLFEDGGYHTKTKKLYEIISSGKVDFGTSLLMSRSQKIEDRRQKKIQIPILSLQ